MSNGVGSLILYTDAKYLAERYANKTNPRGLIRKVDSVGWVAHVLRDIGEAMKIQLLTIISHGGPGSLDFPSGGPLSIQNVDRLKNYQGVFAPGARILIGGCDAGRSPDGEYFMVRLAQALLVGRGGALIASNRVTVTFLERTDLRTQGIWKKVVLGPGGGVTRFENVQHLDYARLGKRIRWIETNLSRGLPLASLPGAVKDLLVLKQKYQKLNRKDFGHLYELSVKVHELHSDIMSHFIKNRPLVR